VLVDLEADVEITDEIVVSKCAWTPFAGRRVRGWPVATLVRGRTVQRNGEILAEPGWGKQAKPSGTTIPEPVAS
jgi:dihydroorotase